MYITSTIISFMLYYRLKAIHKADKTSMYLVTSHRVNVSCEEKILASGMYEKEGRKETQVRLPGASERRKLVPQLSSLI